MLRRAALSIALVTVVGSGATSGCDMFPKCDPGIAACCQAPAAR